MKHKEKENMNTFLEFFTAVLVDITSNVVNDSECICSLYAQFLTYYFFLSNKSVFNDIPFLPLVVERALASKSAG